MPTMGPWTHPFSGVGGIGWWLGSAVGLLLLVGLAVVVARLLQGPGDGSVQQDAALGLAWERYAHGEITREQFAQLRTDLE